MESRYWKRRKLPCLRTSFLAHRVSEYVFHYVEPFKAFYANSFNNLHTRNSFLCRNIHRNTPVFRWLNGSPGGWTSIKPFLQYICCTKWLCATYRHFNCFHVLIQGYHSMSEFEKIRIIFGFDGWFTFLDGGSGGILISKGWWLIRLFDWYLVWRLIISTSWFDDKIVFHQIGGERKRNGEKEREMIIWSILVMVVFGEMFGKWSTLVKVLVIQDWRKLVIQSSSWVLKSFLRIVGRSR